MNLDAEQTAWQRKENSKLKPENKHFKRPKRSYLHFDKRVSELSDDLTRKLTDPSKIATHRFFPFIRFEKRDRVWVTEDYVKSDGTPTKIRKVAKEKKIRKISFAAHLDALIFSWFSHKLTPFYENELKKYDLRDNVVAFRQEVGSTYDVVSEVISEIKKNDECAILCFDISSYFDEIHPEKLKKKWMDLVDTTGTFKGLPPDHYNVFKAHTKWSWVDLNQLRSLLHIKKTDRVSDGVYCKPEKFRELKKKSVVHIEGKGIPQGSPLSPLLSNLYLLNFDKSMKTLVDSIGGLYRRYCDDILIICPIKDIEKVRVKVLSEIAEEGLKIKNKKTSIHIYRMKGGKASIEDIEGRGFQYLGIAFDGIRVSIRSSTRARFWRRMSNTVKRERGRYRYLKGIMKIKGINFRKRFPYRLFSSLSKKPNYINYTKQVDEAFKNKSVKRSIVPKNTDKVLSRKIDAAKVLPWLKKALKNLGKTPNE